MRQRLFASLYDRVMQPYESVMRARKAELFADLPRDVVEIGPGTGANLEFLRAGTRWVGIEPNLHMRRRLAARLATSEVDGRLLGGTAEETQLPDESSDAVICTLVLCSVCDQDAALAEVGRILRPGGRLVFIEHVAAPAHTWLRRWQAVTNPLWKCLACGCHLQRDTAAALARAGFSRLTIEEFRVPTPPAIPLVAPHICGIAYK
jgi:ubiquinone/menaquinone biosynthesis C-methylase UbiE